MIAKKAADMSAIDVNLSFTRALDLMGKTRWTALIAVLVLKYLKFLWL